MRARIIGVLLSLSFAAQAQWPTRVRLLKPDERVVELRQIAPDGDSTLICKAPCEAVVQLHANDRFVLDGPELRRSEPFSLPERGGDLTLRANPTSRSSRVAGFVVLGVGGGTAAAGALAWLFTASLSGAFCDGEAQCTSRDNDRVSTARTVTLVGAGVAVVGLVVLYLSRKPTEVSIDP